MSEAARKSDELEDRFVILENLGLEERALRYNRAADTVTVVSDEQAFKNFYARAFDEWAGGNVVGTAREIFDRVTAIIESK
jgi:hypothetical protein